MGQQHFTATLIITRTREEVKGNVDHYNRQVTKPEPRIVREIGKIVVRADTLEALENKCIKAIGVIAAE